VSAPATGGGEAPRRLPFTSGAFWGRNPAADLANDHIAVGFGSHFCLGSNLGAQVINPRV